MLIEATPFAKSSSNGDNGSGWSIKRLAYPEYVLSPLRLYGVCGAKICLKTTGPGLVSILTAQNYCNFSKLPTFYPLICIVFIPKTCFHPPILICINPPWSCLSARLGMVITRFWWGKLPPSCRLLLVSSALFCPLLSYSLSSVSLREFFGVAHLITCRTDCKLLQERSPAILSCHGKTRASSVLRMAYRIFPFFMRSFF